MKEHKLTTGNLNILNLVQKIEKFKEFSDQELRSFIDAGRLREYEANEIIIKEGGFDCWVYFLINGTLAMTKDGQNISMLKRCGDMFGEMGIIDGSPRSATILAHSKSVLLGFDASLIDQKLKSNQINFCYITYRIFAEVLAVRLRNTTKQNVELTKENINLKKEILSLKNKLTAHKPSSQKISKSSQLKPKSLTPKKILVVDEVEPTRKMLRSILREFKCGEIFVAVDGENALKILGEDKIDLIIADCDLSKMSSLDLLKKVRANPVSKTTPFVLLINQSDKKKADLAIKERVSQFIVKPYTANKMYEQISKFLH